MRVKRCSLDCMWRERPFKSSVWKYWW